MGKPLFDLTEAELFSRAQKAIDESRNSENSNQAYHCASTFNLANIYRFLEHATNGGALGYSSWNKGLELGAFFLTSHRTLQGSIVNALLGILYTIGKTTFVDARNEVAIKACQFIKEAIDTDKIKIQPFI